MVTATKTKTQPKTKTKTQNKVLIALPVYNEEDILEQNCLKVLQFCKNNLEYNFKIVIADNKSTDNTSDIGKKLDKNHKEITYLSIVSKGKGLAISKAWGKFRADFYTFMDIDLSTDLKAFPRLLESLERKDIVVGSRYKPESKCKRSISRLIVSKAYNFLLNLLFKTSFSDLAVGFKGARSRVVEKVLPLCENKSWFFDSEFVIISKILGFKVKEIPIVWFPAKNRESKVSILKVALEYFKNMLQLRKRVKKLKNIDKHI